MDGTTFNHKETVQATSSLRRLYFSPALLSPFIRSFSVIISFLGQVNAALWLHRLTLCISVGRE
jgi:Asp-tRNA(Asn)/Glu-tRNA(Gln) amidotransferase C subunit